MMTRAKVFWADLCLNYRKTVLALLIGTTWFAGSQLQYLEFDNAMDIWFLDDDPAYMAHRRMVENYSSDEVIVVGIETDDVFTQPVVGMVADLTAALESAPHVEKVTSLTSVEAIEGRDDVLDIGDLIELPVTDDELAAVRTKTLANDLYVGNIVSETGDFTVVLARLPSIEGDFSYRMEAVLAVEEIIAEFESDPANSGYSYYISGGPPVDVEFFRLSEQDNLKMTVGIFTLVSAALWFLLGSFNGVWLSLATVVVAIVWAHGWIALAGVKTNMVTTMLPGLLIAVGVADSVHVLVEYQNKLREHGDKTDALRAVYVDLITPLSLTTLTTAIGMLSLMVSKVQGIREFGFFSALGVVGAFVLSITFVPILLSYLPQPRILARRKADSVRSERLLEKLHLLTVNRGGWIAGISAVALAFAAAGASQVKTESQFIEAFPDGHPAKVHTRKIEDALSGVMTMDVLIHTGEEGGVKDPAFLKKIEAFGEHMEGSQYVKATMSIADSMKDMRRAFHSNDQAEYQLPASREEAAQYLLLYEMDAPDGDLKEAVSYLYDEARVTARVGVSTSTVATELVERAETYVAREFNDAGMTTTVTGLTRLYSDMENYIRQSLLLGFSIAFVAIYIIFSLQMRSPVLGAIAMIPNVVPILISLGVMGASDIRLDSMTCMVASIAIGLAVDDTIHFVSRIRRRLGAGAGMEESLLDATVEVGRALVYTSITLCCGFGVMMTASFVGIFYFGLLCTLTVFFALIADLLLLPVVLRWYGGPGAEGAPVAAPEEAMAAQPSAAR